LRIGIRDFSDEFYGAVNLTHFGFIAAAVAFNEVCN
jgi:hypothetical protein